MTAWHLYHLLEPGARALFSASFPDRPFHELILMIVCEQACNLFSRDDQIFEFAFTRIRQLGWDRMSLQ